MDRALRPGMRLMRILGVSGKFAVIAVLLVLPLIVSLGTAWLHSSGDLRLAIKERQALQFAGPLVRLSTELSLVGPDGESPLSTATVAQVDEANRRVGVALGVDAAWFRLRRLVQPLTSGARPGQPSREGAFSKAAGDCRDLIESVVDAGGLRLDAESETYPLIITMVDEIPGIARYAGEAGRVDDNDREGLLTRAERLGALRSELADHHASVLANLVKVRNLVKADPGGQPLVTTLNGLLSDVQSLVDQIEHSAAWRQPAAATPTAPVSDAVPGSLREPVRSVATAAIAPSPAAIAVGTGRVSIALQNIIDDRLSARSGRLAAVRTLPLAVTLAILAGAAYLFLALYRSTSQDLNFILGDIERVGEGGVQSTDGLPGTDEFAQMSRAVVEARDQLVAAMGELSYLARHDELTSLGNRRFLMEKLDQHLTAQPHGQSVGALALLDAVGLKDVNDSFGDAIGDQILLNVTRRLHRAIPRRDVVARISGEQFGLLLGAVASAEAARTALDEIIAAVEQPIPVGGRRVHVRVHAGVAMIEAKKSAEEIFRDAAVAKATTYGPSRPHVEVFAPRLRQAHRNRVELSADLVQALELGELSLDYQPLVDLAGHSLYGVEALVRWNHPTRGLLGPDTFIPLAESTGLIEPLGRWVLREAAGQLATWSAAYPDGFPIRMDVNVSPAQLAQEHLVTDLVSVLEETGLDPQRIVLEITETALMADVDSATRRVRQLAAIGVTISLDDFGTGYSSLAYLGRMPVTVLKIDKSFVGGADHYKDRSGDLLHSIVSLARSLGLQTVAEGIETADQAAQLREFGCHLGQGYLFGRPVSAEQMTHWLDLASGGRAWPFPGTRFPIPRGGTNGHTDRAHADRLARPET